MRERHQPDQYPCPSPDPPEAGRLDQARQEAEDLLLAGEEAIRRALSGDSREFLRASRQEGGE